MNDASLRFATSTFVSLVLALAAGCNGASTEPIIAAEGGAITSSSHDLTIPASSLTADTEVTLNVVGRDALPPIENARAEVLQILPAGTVLEAPATVTIHDSFIGANDTDTVRVAQLVEGDGEAFWRDLVSTRDSETGDVTTQVDRFAPIAIVVEPAAEGAATILGTLTWGSGEPAEGLELGLVRDDSSTGTGTSPFAFATTDALGVFTFADLEPGAYRIQANTECAIDEPVVVEAGERLELSLTLCGGSSRD